MSRFCAQCEAHRVEIERLKEEVAAWKVYAAGETESALVTNLARRFQLSPSRARILAYLMQRSDRIVAKTALLEASRGNGCHKAAEDLDSKLLDVQVYHVRKGLAAQGVHGAIKAHWGQGYSLARSYADQINALTRGEATS